MSEREKLKKLAERCNYAVEINRKNKWDGDSEYSGAITANPSTILALLSELEQAEARLEHLVPFEEYDKAMIRAGDLQKFKQYVHDRLDAAGIDKHEEQNAINGCRIGSRLDDVLKAAAELEQAERERDELSDLKDAMVAYAKRIQAALSAEPGQELDKVATEKMRALRTLRQASQKIVEASANGDIACPASLDESFDALAAALAAEGGK